MDLITKERDRLLQRGARVYGLGFAIASLVTLLLPGAIDRTALLICLPLYLLLGVAFVRIGSTRGLGWVITALVAGAAVLAVLGVVGDPPAEAGVSAALLLASGSLPAVALVLTTSAARITVLVVGALATGAVAVVAGETVPAIMIRTAGFVLAGWLIPVFVAVWFSAAVPQVDRRIASIGRAHRAERQASELEAQRRQGARLLHDTVLATLTLLAHSGVGVEPQTLRDQAGQDAELLRQLRLGNDPTPQVTGTSTAVGTPDEATLGNTLESVKQRFGRMGLQVSWHGTGQVLLPTVVLDAFLLALAECLENVRRHSGVTQAHVTITEDGTTVRAMVTDSGVGFDIADVDAARMGFAESVVARLRDVGGNARLFSAPGSGTTVVLEVPR